VVLDGYTFRVRGLIVSSGDIESRVSVLLHAHTHFRKKKSQLKQKVLLELHTSAVGGHSGFLKTYHTVEKEFFWDGLKTDFQRFVAECLVCQKHKVETIKSPCLLQPLAIPSQCWRRFPWISSQGYRSLKEILSSW
jgi:hypothetical protein